jgi:cellulose 1,4-beta-cellobiosidase
MQKRAFIVSSLLAAVRAQQVGTLEAETHPSLTWQRCTGTGGTSCTNVNGKIVLDSNWRWVHNTAGYANCYDGNEWVAEHCPDPETCTANCALEGANYSGTYGITTSGNALTLKFVTTNSNGKNIGSRVYLMADDNKYEMFKLKNREFTFDAEMGQAVCGLNGAVYFISMDADGGLSRYPGNKAGAKYGTGYCDSQCPRDIKFIGGQVRLVSLFPLHFSPGQR